MVRGLVLADRLEHFAERRIDDAVDQQKAGEHDDENEDVHRHLVGQIEHAEQVAARHRLDAVLAAGELRPQREEIHHLRQRQRDHGEVDALAADGEAPAITPSTAAAAVPTRIASSGGNAQTLAA